MSLNTNEKADIKSNHIFKVPFDNYQNIKQFITEKFKINPKQSSSNSIVDLFEIKTNEGKITFTLYKTNKLMVQSNPNNNHFINIVKEISDFLAANPKKQNNIVSPLEDKLEFDYYIGCDEAGRGETFGSLYLGCALIKKENLKLIEETIKNKNIRKLPKKNIETLKNNLLNKYEFLSKKYSAGDIDNNSLTVLLDKGYKQLLSEIIDNKKNLIVAIDNYGIGRELKDFLNTIEKQSEKVVVENKADENYTACKVASLGARALRVKEIEELNYKFALVEESTGKKIYPGKGSASNSDTKKYLELFRKQNPYSDFPPFVRKKWSNVKLIDMEYPKK